MNQRTRGERIGKAAVSVGFLALLAGIVVAHRTPATGYEVSVYRGTPLAFWVTFVVAILVSVTVAFGTGGWVRRAALLLGGTSVATMAALPLIRGYYFYGEPDSLTHIGWIRDIATGRLSPFEIFYPGIHLVTTLLHDATGVPLTQASMFMVTAMVMVFLVFVALTVRVLADDELAVVIAAVSGFMLLPINNITIQVLPHPISQSVLLTALVLYLLFKYMQGAPSRAPPPIISSMGIAFGIVLMATVFYHPQQALVVLLLFGGVVFAQFVHRRLDARSFVTKHRPMYTQTGILLLVFLAWVTKFGAFFHQVDLVLGAIGDFFFGEGGAVGGTVAQRQESLVGIGVGLEEIFVKLFIVGAVYAAFAGVMMIASLGGWLEERVDLGDAAARYLAYGMFLLFPVAALHLVGNLSKLFFRYMGTMMLIATILGTVALYRLGRDQYGAAPTRALLSVALLTMLALSLVTVFPSPYTHQPSMHVSEAQHEGYDAAFQYEVEDAEYVGVRWSVWRMRHATQGVTGVPWGGETINASVLRSDVSGQFDDDGYVVVTEFDQQRELEVYRGLRFSRADFQGVRTQRNVHRVQSNGEVTVYYAD